LPVGFFELVVLFVIGLLILGPERLPRVASQIGRWVGRARRMANQLRYQLEREIALADLEKSKPARDDKKSEKKNDKNDKNEDRSGSAEEPARHTGEAAPDSSSSEPGDRHPDGVDAAPDTGEPETGKDSKQA